MKHDHKQANKKQRNMKTTWAYESIKRKQMEKQRNEKFPKEEQRKLQNSLRNKTKEDGGRAWGGVNGTFLEDVCFSFTGMKMVTKLETLITTTGWWRRRRRSLEKETRRKTSLRFSLSRIAESFLRNSSTENSRSRFRGFGFFGKNKN